MKSCLFAAAFIATTASVFAGGGKSARESIRALARAQGSDVMTRIVNVSGTRGQDQPFVWRLVTADGKNQFREYFVQDGRIVAQGPVAASLAAAISGHAVPPKRLQYDSTLAFAAVEKAAKAARVGFDSADYDLRCLELSDRPVWFITLWDQHGAKVGQVSVGGDTGKILRKQFFTPGIANAPRAAAPPVLAKNSPPRQAGAPQPPTDVYQPAEQPGFWDKTKEGVARSTNLVKESVTQASGKVRGFFDRVMGREQQQPDDYLYGRQTQPATPPQPGR